MDWMKHREKVMHWLGKYRYILLVVLLGFCLMLIPSGNVKKTSETPSPTVSQESGMTVSQELEEILSHVQGAGKVQVMLTVAKGEETIYQTDGSTAESGNRHDTVVITDENRTQSGLIQQSIPPTYRGAIVVCQGADSPAVCLAIKEAVSKVTGLDSSQISVLKMK